MVKKICLLLFLFSSMIFAEQSEIVTQYDPLYKNCAQHQLYDTAVLLVAFNRPHYLAECLRSIEQNPESQVWTFIFALDGGSQSTQLENYNLIMSSSIKNKIVLQRERNYGCPKNHLDAKRFAFDWCNFSKVIVMEDDIIITPTYFSFLLNFYTWANKNYNNIGAVQAWSYCFLTQAEKAVRLQCVRENRMYWSFVTYCLDQRCWNTIKPILYAYEKMVDEIPLASEYDPMRSKPYKWDQVGKIRSWIRSLVRDKKTNTQGSYVSKLKLKSVYLSSKFRPNQDQMMGFAFYLNDLVKLQTVVNRVVHIGKEGITSTESSFIDHQYHKIVLDHFEEDKEITEFKLI